MKLSFFSHEFVKKMLMLIAAIYATSTSAMGFGDLTALNSNGKIHVTWANDKSSEYKLVILDMVYYDPMGMIEENKGVSVSIPMDSSTDVHTVDVTEYVPKDGTSVVAYLIANNNSWNSRQAVINMPVAPSIVTATARYEINDNNMIIVPNVEDKNGSSWWNGSHSFEVLSQPENGTIITENQYWNKCDGCSDGTEPRLTNLLKYIPSETPILGKQTFTFKTIDKDGLYKVSTGEIELTPPMPIVDNCPSNIYSNVKKIEEINKNELNIDIEFNVSPCHNSLYVTLDGYGGNGSKNLYKKIQTIEITGTNQVVNYTIPLQQSFGGYRFVLNASTSVKVQNNDPMSGGMWGNTTPTRPSLSTSFYHSITPKINTKLSTEEKEFKTNELAIITVTNDSDSCQVTNNSLEALKNYLCHVEFENLPEGFTEDQSSSTPKILGTRNNEGEVEITANTYYYEYGNIDSKKLASKNTIKIVFTDSTAIEESTLNNIPKAALTVQSITGMMPFYPELTANFTSDEKSIVTKVEWYLSNDKGINWYPLPPILTSNRDNYSVKLALLSPRKILIRAKSLNLNDVNAYA